MSSLSVKARSALSAAVFAAPGRSYPIPDKAHARAALSRASAAVNSGRMSSAEGSKIAAKAHRKLGYPAGSVAHDRASASLAHPGK